MAASEEELQVQKPSSISAKRVVSVTLLVTIPIVVFLVLDEFHSSRWQAKFLTRLGQELTFQVAPGKSNSIRYPTRGGPYDQRLGYANLPNYVERLQARGFTVAAQAQQSSCMAQLFDQGLFMPYREKDQAGLKLIDSHHLPIYASYAPQRIYPNFQSLPRPLVNALLYIENHSLLDEGAPQRNPAIEWSRFGRALSDEAIHLVYSGYHPAGGSTLATQIEKYRHSPDGRTNSPREKMRQMVSASVRAYLQGEDTTVVRQQLVVNYLNTVPLAARAGFGEIAGVGDGLWAWYGRDFKQVNRLLNDDPAGPLQERALVFKEVLSLMISQRRPSYYLSGDMKALESLTNSYLRLMAKDNVITPALRDAALKQSLRQQKERVRLPTQPPIERKGVNAVRIKLAALLGVPQMYDLDRLDLTVNSTLDSRLQQEVTAELIKLRDPDYAYSVGLNDQHLLEHGDPHGVTYSFTLIESTPQGNKVRVQADNFDQPFDINDGTKLDLGSTAKLRTLLNYLEIIADLHKQYGSLGKEALTKIQAEPHESIIRRWVIDYLAQASDRSLTAMLEASLQRQYSANPGESFFTGGGLHTFENFDKADNFRTLTVREAVRRSVNLVFIRLMRDVVHYYMEPASGSSEQLLENVDNPQRQEYLRRFADREGRTFLSAFYHKYQGKSIEESEARLMEGIHPSPKRLAVIFRSIAPNASLDQFVVFMSTYLPTAGGDHEMLAKLYDDYSPQRFNLQDRGYLAGIHPLELWLLAYLRAHPTAGYSEIVRASVEERQEVYQWLFKSRRKHAQDKRIKELLEADGFKQVHKAWKRLGYPFDSLVPSYATAIGASADRPAALAALMGIVVNDGVHLPISHIDSLHFAANTPYDTLLFNALNKGERVLPPEIPQLVRQVLSEVVDQGTARRLAGAFNLPNGAHVMVGGKTGTGDNRFKTFAKGGGLISERVVSRSGAFVFYLGDHYFGTLVAYVAGPQAADYKFTSALPVQILKVLAPTLKQRLNLGVDSQLALMTLKKPISNASGIAMVK
ncbi:transglycosylase domain-containing protein [Pseudogulbenkiania subflava]|uniref:peptidoglycan glycosyltransferase n=1 Tax=Pseudogulbenkiania subflava DSM 22618 TaxID=1123014 RepID=A0A1Y6BXS3_9NEIS|nr:transglycosylase domain-containing protein [Pseudogulbenkiania subflava]SMF23431.1 Membrane carboxypeptidase (penicillin-binding protein) [Pseudogulbenkiania subflava DSM 22618]SMF32791.1 Membrane carboxypeptidase (penicillin-binding protein) [Pseudogulbenkiania subflava DSM 22618]SMF47794.1 Membrane carboxypeptidase (penicillin-binding protein) [Pseudogulbenkiania subflava DSM 22618]